MTLGERLKMYRTNKGLSQEKVAELVGVSRQAVTKWESNQTSPASDNLIALSSIYEISLDELVGGKNKGKENKILQTNMTRLAIVFHAAALNICIQPFDSEVGGKADTVFVLVKLIMLLACSIWMAFNLRYEKNAVQYRKNTKIELLYCILQVIVAMFAFYSRQFFWGTVLIIVVCAIYLFVINPKYMNRTFVKKKTM